MVDLNTSDTLLLGVIVVSVMALFTFTIIRLVSRAYTPDPHILKEGVAAQATVTSARQSGVRLGSRGYGLELELEVRSPGFEPYPAKARILAPIFDAHKYTPGAVIAVKIHPDDPSKVIVDL